MGHKLSSCLRFFDRLLCEVKQPLISLPGELLQSANSGPPRIFLSDDQKSHQGDEIENHKDDLKQYEARVDDHIESFFGHGEPLSVFAEHEV